jgi:hypothetical protein
MKLGSIVNNIRNSGHYADHRNDLYEMGFLFERQYSTFEEVKLAYKSLYGHLEVPVAYVMGDDDERYPEEVRGMKLGSIVSVIRSSGSYADHREELQGMGFLFERQSSTLEEVKTALLAYKSLYGHLKVPQSYIIGDDDERYPEEVRGMKLGSLVNNIRSSGSYADHREELESLGLRIRSNILPYRKLKYLDIQQFNII